MSNLSTYDRLMELEASASVSNMVNQMISEKILQNEDIDEKLIKLLKTLSEEDIKVMLEYLTKCDNSHVTNNYEFVYEAIENRGAENGAKSIVTSSSSSSMKPVIADDITSVASSTTQVNYEDSTLSTAHVQKNVKDISDQAKIKELLARTRYSLVLSSGQRRYGGPPPNWEGSMPGQGEKKFCSQVYVGKLSKDTFEDTLVPILEEFGQIYELRIMVNPQTGENKGFAFCVFTTKEAAQNFVKANDKRLINGQTITATLSRPNCRLYIGGIPRNKNRDEVYNELVNLVDGLEDVIMYSSAEDKSRNRGYVFLEFKTHQDASIARKKISSGKVKVFNRPNQNVDWADPMEEVDEEALLNVKCLFVRNFATDTTDEKLKSLFAEFGEISEVKKYKDFAFVTYASRESAENAREQMNKKEIDGLTMEVNFAKPNNQNNRKTNKRRKPTDDRYPYPMPRNRTGFPGPYNTRSLRLAHSHGPPFKPYYPPESFEYQGYNSDAYPPGPYPPGMGGWQRGGGSAGHPSPAFRYMMDPMYRGGGEPHAPSYYEPTPPPPPAIVGAPPHHARIPASSKYPPPVSIAVQRGFNTSYTAAPPPPDAYPLRPPAATKYPLMPESASALCDASHYWNSPNPRFGLSTSLPSTIAAYNSYSIRPDAPPTQSYEALNTRGNIAYPAAMALNQNAAAYQGHAAVPPHNTTEAANVNSFPLSGRPSGNMNYW